MGPGSIFRPMLLSGTVVDQQNQRLRQEKVANTLQRSVPSKKFKVVDTRPIPHWGIFFLRLQWKALTILVSIYLVIFPLNIGWSCGFSLNPNHSICFFPNNWAQASCTPDHYLQTAIHIPLIPRKSYSQIPIVHGIFHGGYLFSASAGELHPHDWELLRIVLRINSSSLWSCPPQPFLALRSPGHAVGGWCVFFLKKGVEKRMKISGIF